MQLQGQNDMMQNILLTTLSILFLTSASCKSLNMNSNLANMNDEEKIKLKIKNTHKKIKLQLGVDEEDITEEKNATRLVENIKSQSSEAQINAIFENLLQKNFKLQSIQSENEIRYVSTHSRYHQMIHDLNLSNSIGKLLNSKKAFRLNALIDEKISELKKNSDPFTKENSLEEEVKILGVLSLCLYHPRKEEIENYFLRKFSQKVKSLNWKEYAQVIFLFRDLFRYMPNKTNSNNLSVFSREFFDFKTNRLIFDDQKTELNFILPIKREATSLNLFIYDKILLENTPQNESYKIKRNPIYLNVNKSDLNINDQIPEKTFELPVQTRSEFPDSELKTFEQENEFLINSNPPTLSGLDKKLVSFQKSEGNRFLFIRWFQPFVSFYYNEQSISNLAEAFSFNFAEIASTLTFTIDYASEKEEILDPKNMAFDSDDKCLYIPHLRMIDRICIQVTKSKDIFQLQF